ncbi:hypothetical protein D3C85_1251760 [compost metagenome]
MSVDPVIADLLELVAGHPYPPGIGNGIGNRQIAVDRLARLDAVCLQYGSRIVVAT